MAENGVNINGQFFQFRDPGDLGRYVTPLEQKLNDNPNLAEQYGISSTGFTNNGGGVQQMLGPDTQFGQYPGQNISQIQHTGDFRPSLPSTIPAPPLNMQPQLPGGGIGSLFPPQQMPAPQQNSNQQIMNAVNNIPSQVTEGVGSLFDSKFEKQDAYTQKESGGNGSNNGGATQPPFGLQPTTPPNFNAEPTITPLPHGGGMQPFPTINHFGLLGSPAERRLMAAEAVPFNNELYASAATTPPPAGANLNNLLTAGADQTGNNPIVNPNMINQNPYGNSSGM
tara:strand:- start:1114 stop:1959 length:846 start_codon:yes stop_codon:yes gene_type:complete